MDLAYLPDCMSFLAVRPRPEQTWVDINKWPDEKQPVQKQSKQDQQGAENCSICKKQKKNKLSSYIKDRLRRESCTSHSIQEEDNESITSGLSNTSRVSGWGKARTTSE